MALLAYRNSLAEGDAGIDFMEDNFSLSMDAEKVFYDLSISRKYAYALFKIQGGMIVVDKTRPLDAIKPTTTALQQKDSFQHMKRELLRAREPRFGLFVRRVGDGVSGGRVRYDTIKFLHSVRSHNSGQRRRYDGAAMTFLADLRLLRIENENELVYKTFATQQ